ncbi:hypothetical protein ACWGIA_21605 [Streptomyces bobili]
MRSQSDLHGYRNRSYHSLGFDTKIVDDYNGPGRAMAVFHRDLPLNVS